MNPSTQTDDRRLLELLQKWQTGDFTRADEQELSALTGSDDFRREAVEGYASLAEADHTAHLNSLRARLRKRAGGGRTVLMPQILAAAAVITVLVGAIWFFRAGPEKESSVAQTAMEPAANDAYLAPDSGSTIEATPEVQGQLEEMTVSSRARSGEGLDRIASESAAPAASQTDADFGNIAAVEEKADDGPPPPGGVTEQSTNLATPREQAERMAKTTGKAKDAEAQPKPIDAKPTAPAKGAEDERLAEYDKAKAKKQEAKEPATRPVGGWDAFRAYLRRNARLTESARQNNVSGSVALRFTVNNRNEAVDFQIIRPLGYGCDEEAVRLVKNHLWQRGADASVLVEVPFVR